MRGEFLWFFGAIAIGLWVYQDMARKSKLKPPPEPGRPASDVPFGYRSPEQRAIEQAATAAHHERAAIADQERQALAVRMVSRPFDTALYSLKLMDEGLRSVQIVGESLSLIALSKNGKTRTSRLRDVQTTIAGLDEQGWDGLNEATQAIVRAEAHRAIDVHAALAANDMLQKHLRAVERAVKPETRAKYIELAREELRGCRATLTAPDMVAELERVQQEFEKEFG